MEGRPRQALSSLRSPLDGGTKPVCGGLTRHRYAYEKEMVGDGAERRRSWSVAFAKPDHASALRLILLRPITVKQS